MSKNAAPENYEFPKPHALCKLFPRPTAEGRAELKRHIKKVGVLKPLIVWNDPDSGKEWLVDGMTRNEVVDELHAEEVYEAENGKAIAKEVERFEGDRAALFEMVIGTNFTRREMTKSQRAALLVTFTDMERKYKGRDSGDYAQQMAEANGVNRQYLFDCKRIKEHKAELLEDVIAGVLSVKDALAKALGKDKGGDDGDKPESAKKDAEPEVVTDGLGNEVAVEFHAIFKTRAEYKAALKGLATARGAILAIAETAGGKTIPKEIGKEFSSLKKLVGDCLPHCVCPDCSGTGKNPEAGPNAKCKTCKGRKYLDRTEFKLLPANVQETLGGAEDAED